MTQSHSLRSVEGDLYVRGAKSTFYVHKRIPAALRLAYPSKKTHITRSLETSDRGEAKRKLPLFLANIKEEFEQMRSRIDLARANTAPVRVTKLSPGQLNGVLDFWSRHIMLSDDLLRMFNPEKSNSSDSQNPTTDVHCAGLDDEEFDELEAELTNQRQEFGRMLARGKVMPFAGALVEFMYLCGIRYEPADGELQTASRQFLVRLVKVLDWRLQRMSGVAVVIRRASGSSACAPGLPRSTGAVGPPGLARRGASRFCFGR